jgi:RND family efflux transporter MFP subunit
MGDSASRLQELRIDRDGRSHRRGRGLWWLVGTVVLLLVGAGAWFEGVIQLPAETAAAVPVPASATATADSAPPGSSLLDASGYIVARRQATVSSKITGKLVEVLVEEGQHVVEGQILARLDDRNASAAVMHSEAMVAESEAQLKAMEVALADAQPAFDRSEELFRRGVTSAQDTETTRSSYNAKKMADLVAQQTLGVARASLAIAKQNMDDTIVRAPFAGVVTVKAAEPGEMVSPAATGGFTRTGICTIVDMNSLEMEVDVSEAFISRVHSGLPATIRLNAYPDWEIPAEVLTVIPAADRAKATVKVRVSFKSKDARIVPDMGARVAFHDERSGTADAAPEAKPARN